MSLAFPNVGDVVAQRYRLDVLMGQGRHGRVYRGSDVRSQRGVLLKLVPLEMLDEQPWVEGMPLDRSFARFQAEIRKLGLAEDPRAFPLLESGRLGPQLFFMVTYADAAMAYAAPAQAMAAPGYGKPAVAPGWGAPAVPQPFGAPPVTDHGLEQPSRLFDLSALQAGGSAGPGFLPPASASQFGISPIRPEQYGAPTPGSPAQVGPPQVGPPKVGPPQVGPPQSSPTGYGAQGQRPLPPVPAPVPAPAPGASQVPPPGLSIRPMSDYADADATRESPTAAMALLQAERMAQAAHAAQAASAADRDPTSQRTRPPAAGPERARRRSPAQEKRQLVVVISIAVTILAVLAAVVVIALRKMQPPAPAVPADQAVLVAPAQVATHRLSIRTSTPALRVFVNDQYRGLSPVEVEVAVTEFPLTVRARLNQKTERTVSVPAPTGEVFIDFAKP